MVDIVLQIFLVQVTYLLYVEFLYDQRFYVTI